MPYYPGKLTSSFVVPQEGLPEPKPQPPLPRPLSTSGILEAEERVLDTNPRSNPASTVRVQASLDKVLDLSRPQIPPL